MAFIQWKLVLNVPPIAIKMYLAKIIINVSILIWLLPPFRQLKGGYFFYFLILGYSDPLALLLLKLLKLEIIYTHLVMGLFLLLAVMFYNKTIKTKWMILLIAFCIIGVSVGNRNFRYLSLILFHLLIFVQLLVPSIKEYFLKHRINLYFTLFLLYELLIILSTTGFAFNYTSGVYFFYLSLAFEMLIGIFFTFYNLVNTPLFKLPFVKKYDY